MSISIPIFIFKETLNTLPEMLATLRFSIPHPAHQVSVPSFKYFNHLLVYNSVVLRTFTLLNNYGVHLELK